MQLSSPPVLVMVPEGVPEPQTDLHPVHRHAGVLQHLGSQLVKLLPSSFRWGLGRSLGATHCASES